MTKENEYRKRFKEDCPETIGETDKEFDDGNFIDWLIDHIEGLETQVKIFNKIGE